MFANLIDDTINELQNEYYINAINAIPDMNDNKQKKYIKLTKENGKSVCIRASSKTDFDMCPEIITYDRHNEIITLFFETSDKFNLNVLYNMFWDLYVKNKNNLLKSNKNEDIIMLLNDQTQCGVIDVFFSPNASRCTHLYNTDAISLDKIYEDIDDVLKYKSVYDRHIQSNFNKRIGIYFKIKKNDTNTRIIRNNYSENNYSENNEMMALRTKVILLENQIAIIKNELKTLNDVVMNLK